MSEWVSEWVSELVIVCLIDWSIDWMSGWVNQSVNELINQSIHQSMDQSSNQSVNHSHCTIFYRWAHKSKTVKNPSKTHFTCKTIPGHEWNWSFTRINGFIVSKDPGLLPDWFSFLLSYHVSVAGGVATVWGPDGGTWEHNATMR